MSSVIVLGGSVAGLMAGLLLSRSGHDVTVLERDRQPPPTDPDAVAAWTRGSVPQAQQAHSFMPLLHRILSARLPDVLADLIAAGAREYPQAACLPPSAAGAHELDPQRVAELVNLGCRRTTFELVIRRSVEKQPGLRLLPGVTATGLRWRSSGAPPRVARAAGVLTAERGELPADVVIDATGRRSAIATWAGEAGVGVPTETEDCEFVANTRFFRLTESAALPAMPRGNVLGVVLDGLAAYAFLADDRTLAVALGRHPRDSALAAARHPAVFDKVLSGIPALAPFVDPQNVQPISGVRVMGGLRSSIRDLLPGGQPALVGAYPIGDALCTTNPAYGRGVALAAAHAGIIADTLAALPDPTREQAERISSALLDVTRPWWRDSIRHDRARSAIWRRTLGLPPSQLAPVPTAVPMPVVAAASSVDAHIWLDFLRVVGLLQRPETVYDNAALAERIAGLQLPKSTDQPTRAQVLGQLHRIPQPRMSREQAPAA